MFDPVTVSLIDLDLDAEAERLRWAAGRTVAPTPITVQADDGGVVLVTGALAGTSAVAPRWLDRPEVAVRAIGRGLRRLHDTLPVDDCPFRWTVDERIGAARRRAAGAGVGVGVGADRSSDAAWRQLAEAAPPIDRLVVCHGDACAPNTLLDDDGDWAGHVDFGALGVGDRWADLAVATWSTEWNYGPGWESLLLDAYGVAPDPERTEYYRQLWDAT